MAITGSLLSNFSSLELSTADDKHYTLKTGPVSKLALRLIGIPHLGFRARARVILDRAKNLTQEHTKVLDAGCGYGLYSLTLAEQNKGYIDAVDLEQPRIDALNRLLDEQSHLKIRIQTRQGSITDLPFDDHSHDLVICSDVIEHIPDDLVAIQEMARVLRPGGTLIISTPYNSTYNQRIFRKFDHQRPGYTTEKYMTLLAPHHITVNESSFYEYRFGTVLFNIFNTIRSKPLMGILFYPFYALYRLDSMMKIGEPNGIVIVATKQS
ncbi:MAG: class I SAM-dependent methyltransferase [Patescibacteria group bacterium]